MWQQYKSVLRAVDLLTSMLGILKLFTISKDHTSAFFCVHLSFYETSTLKSRLPEEDRQFPKEWEMIFIKKGFFFYFLPPSSNQASICVVGSVKHTVISANTSS